MKSPIEDDRLNHPNETTGKTGLSSAKHRPLSRTVSNLCDELSERLPEEEYLLLKLMANNTPFRTIAAELNSTAYTARRLLNASLTNISSQHSTVLSELARFLDLALDETNGESDFKSITNRLELKSSQIKFLILLTKDFVKHPVQHYKNRIFRIKTNLNRSP
ncbi:MULTISPECIES: hypothetical protein [unclassified Endozoicomonas]|uniref:hypothetical protein n=1 Tax=unclassified Endozoicomonas TaxID=2644528 RepID=UPI003BB56F8F